MQIYTLDHAYLGTSHAIASFLVVGETGLALVETGPTSSTQTVYEAVKILGFDPDAIKHVLVTHIHLDHAGGAGWWARKGAQIYVHPRGARHLIDPSRLMESARMVYGDALDELFGEMIPIPSEQVTVVEDGDRIDVGDLAFIAYDTPGHAKHHHAYALGDVLFTGDAAGSRLPGESFINLTSAPPQFDPDAFEATISRMEQLDFNRLYLTHFGRIEDVAEHWRQLRQVVRDSAEFVREQLKSGASERAVVQRYVRNCKQRALMSGVSADTLEEYAVANGFEMSAEGIILYWKRCWKKEQENG